MASKARSRSRDWLDSDAGCECANAVVSADFASTADTWEQFSGGLISPRAKAPATKPESNLGCSCRASAESAHTELDPLSGRSSNFPLGLQLSAVEILDQLTYPSSHAGQSRSGMGRPASKPPSMTN